MVESILVRAIFFQFDFSTFDAMHANFQLTLSFGLPIDTDTIVIKPLDNLPTNAIGYQDASQKSLNGAVLKFEQPGHAYMKACLEEFLTNFQNRKWGANGPDLLTRVYFSSNHDWDNLQPLNRRVFQYFTYKRIQKACYEDVTDAKLGRMKGIRENAYVVHLNNHIKGMIREGSTCDCLYNAFCLSEPKDGEWNHRKNCWPLMESQNASPGWS